MSRTWTLIALVTSLGLGAAACSRSEAAAPTAPPVQAAPATQRDDCFRKNDRIRPIDDQK